MRLMLVQECRACTGSLSPKSSVATHLAQQHIPHCPPSCFLPFPVAAAVKSTTLPLRCCGVCPAGVAPEKLKRTPSLSALDELVMGRDSDQQQQCFVFMLKVGVHAVMTPPKALPARSSRLSVAAWQPCSEGAWGHCPWMSLRSQNCPLHKLVAGASALKYTQLSRNISARVQHHTLSSCLRVAVC